MLTSEDRRYLEQLRVELNDLFDHPDVDDYDEIIFEAMQLVEQYERDREEM